jgi:hypothetical protein
MQVPPNPWEDQPTATVIGSNGLPTPTTNVTTFVQGYTGAGERVEVWGEGRVWWVVMGAVAAGMAAVL